MNQPQQRPQPPRTRAVLYTIGTLLAATAAFFGFGAIGAELNDDDSGTSCQAALQRDFDKSQATGTQAKGLPGECAGVDPKTLERYAGELMEKELGEGLEEVWSSPPAQP